MGEEAAHALGVKRLRLGEGVELIDGRGGVCSACVIEGGSDSAKPKGKPRELWVKILDARSMPPITPRLEVYTATPKGGRVDDMVDQLTQVGVAGWGPLVTARGVVDPREHKLDRLARIAKEACKQAGRPWAMDVLASCDLHTVLRAEGGVRVIVADVSGASWSSSMSGDSLRLLVGPEGGWTELELNAARTAGATIARFGPHVMRIETAAVVAAGVVLAGSGFASML